MSPQQFNSNLDKLYRTTVTSLLGVVLYFIVKVDRKIDLTYEMVMTQQTRIEIHDEQLKNFRAEFNDLKGNMKYVMNNTHPQ